MRATNVLNVEYDKMTEDYLKEKKLSFLLLSRFQRHDDDDECVCMRGETKI